LGCGRFFFKSKITTVGDNGLVSMIIPIYNQKNMIKVVIEAIYASSYKNVVVADERIRAAICCYLVLVSV